MDKYEKEKKVLTQLYANQADSIKFLPFFFHNMKELRLFFNQFGGKTLVLPDTFEEFMQYCLYCDKPPENNKRCGIDNRIHNKIKHKIINAYLNLYDKLEDVLIHECKK